MSHMPTETGSGDGIAWGSYEASNAADEQRIGRQWADYQLSLRAQRRARRLGWFGIGRGFMRMLTRGGLARAIGVGDDRRTRSTLLALGAFELGSGLALVSRDRPAPWLWARLAGDALDVGLLVRAFASPRGRLPGLTAALGGALATAGLDLATSRELRRVERALLHPRRPRVRHIVKTVSVDRPPEELYAFWRDLQNLPRFMSSITSVEVIDDRRSRWRAKLPGKMPAGKWLEWDAEIVADTPNEQIAWRAAPGSRLPMRGEVRFVRGPGGKGAVVRVELQLGQPRGAMAGALARLVGHVREEQVARDLLRFKQVMELGEVVHSDSSLAPGRHPAQPPEGI